MLASIATLSLAFAPLAGLQDGWPQFRGPGGRCVADDTRIPSAFGPGEKVRWKTEIPGGHSSPCIADGRIFLTGFADGKNVALGIDQASGKVLWTKTFPAIPATVTVHPDAVPALPTAVSDGELVVFYFGDWGLVAFDLDGEELWRRPLPNPRYAFGIGTSPILFEGMLILQRDGGPEAAILCFDVSDGTELWRIDRFGYGESHGTPFLWNNEDRAELVLGGTNKLCSYDPATGELLWSVDGLTNFPCTTPVADADTLYFAAWSTPNATGRTFWEEAFNRSLEVTDAEVADPALLFARLDANKDGKIVESEVPECRAKDAFLFLDRNGTGAWELEEIVGAGQDSSVPGANLMVAVARGAAGDASKSHVRWTAKRGLPYVSSPLCYRGRIWLFKSGGNVTCLDAKTGKTIFDRDRLSDRSEYYLSPVGAAGRVIAGSAEGTLYVLDADAGELVVQHTVQFDEELFATPAVLDGTLYVRTKSTLWAFGEAHE